jgi:hypothetical protein
MIVLALITIVSIDLKKRGRRPNQKAVALKPLAIAASEATMQSSQLSTMVASLLSQ